jgi:hypothetical protein
LDLLPEDFKACVGENYNRKERFKKAREEKDEQERFCLHCVSSLVWSSRLGMISKSRTPIVAMLIYANGRTTIE